MQLNLSKIARTLLVVALLIVAVMPLLNTTHAQDGLTDDELALVQRVFAANGPASYATYMDTSTLTQTLISELTSPELGTIEQSRIETINMTAQVIAGENPNILATFDIDSDVFSLTDGEGVAYAFSGIGEARLVDGTLYFQTQYVETDDEAMILPQLDESWGRTTTGTEIPFPFFTVGLQDLLIDSSTYGTVPFGTEALVNDLASLGIVLSDVTVATDTVNGEPVDIISMHVSLSALREFSDDVRLAVIIDFVGNIGDLGIFGELADDAVVTYSVALDSTDDVIQVSRALMLSIESRAVSSADMGLAERLGDIDITVNTTMNIVKTNTYSQINGTFERAEVPISQ